MNAPVALAQPQTARFTTEEFLAMNAAGVLSRFAKTELIDGEIIVLNAQFSEHFTVKTRLLRRLADACDALGTGVEAWSEGTIAIPPDSLPEPDLFITRATPVSGPVDCANVLLVAEIASTTLSQDLGRKVDLYAAAAIGEYWVVNVEARVIHRMWAAREGSYQRRDLLAFGARLSSATIDGLAIDTVGI